MYVCTMCVCIKRSQQQRGAVDIERACVGIGLGKVLLVYAAAAAAAAAARFPVIVRYIGYY